MIAPVHPPLFLNRDIVLYDLRVAITAAQAALAAEIKDKARKGFSAEERSSAISYREGYLRGLQAVEKML